MKKLKPSEAGLNEAISYLRAGKAVVFPTDTAYALGVDATNARAVRRLFLIKKRRPQKPVHIVVAGLAMAKRYAKFTPQAEKLFRKFLPGRLTLVLELKYNPPQSPLILRGEEKREGGGVPPLSLRGGEGELLALWLLSAGTGTIGIRMPKNKIALRLVKKLGRPITATSANVSDAPTAYSPSQIAWQYRHAALKPDLVLDSGKLRKVQPSTMVQLKGGNLKILRRGPITKTQIRNALQF